MEVGSTHRVPSPPNMRDMARSIDIQDLNHARSLAGSGRYRTQRALAKASGLSEWALRHYKIQTRPSQMMRPTGDLRSLDISALDEEVSPLEMLDTHALYGDMRAMWSAKSMAEGLRLLAEGLDRSSAVESTLTKEAREAAAALEHWDETARGLWDGAQPPRERDRGDMDRERMMPHEILDSYAVGGGAKSLLSPDSMAETLREVSRELDQAIGVEPAVAARAATDARAAAAALEQWSAISRTC